MLHLLCPVEAVFFSKIGGTRHDSSDLPGIEIAFRSQAKVGFKIQASGQEAVIDEIFGWWGLDSRAVGKKTV